MNATVTLSKEADTAEQNNAILVTEINGVVVHQFCTKAFADAHLDATKEVSGGAVFEVESGLSADQAYDFSPDVRLTVAEAKARLLRNIRVRDALNKHGVPEDKNVRSAVSKAIADLQASGFF